MKKIITIQLIVLAITLLLGSVLKGDLTSGVRLFHRIFAVAASVAGLVSVCNAFTQKQPTSIKVLTILAFLLILLAAMGGKATQNGGDYNAAFNQMRLSGTGALLLTLVAFLQVNRGVSSKS